MYNMPVVTLNEVKPRVQNNCQEIMEMPGMFKRVQESTKKRAEA